MREPFLVLAKVLAALAFILPVFCVIMMVTHPSPEDAKTLKIEYHDYDIVNIDGCQYIHVQVPGYTPVYTHKGNCTNSCHSYSEPQ